MRARRKPVRREAVRRPPGRAAGLSILLGVLGASAYFSSVLFAVTEGGASTAADAVAGKIAIGAAGSLCGLGVLAAIAALRGGGRRWSAFAGLVLCAAFLAFVGVSLARS